MKVAVLMGGQSSEREVSLVSGQAVLGALKKAGVDAFALDPQDRPLAALSSAEFDVAFVLLHGGAGEDGRIQSVLDLLGKPFTGSGPAACALAMDKEKAKAVFRGAGLPVADSLVLADDSSDAVIERFGRVMVKPVSEGSSVGNAICTTADQLDRARAEFAQYAPLMAEAFVEGDEYTVAIVADVALPVIKIQPASGVYDYAAKYQTGDTQYHIPCGLSDDDESDLQSLAMAAHRALGCRGWSRVDFIRGPDGFVILEVNTVPGMTETSLVPKAAAAAGLSFEGLTRQILEAAHG